MKNLTKSNTYLKFLVVLATFMMGFATIFLNAQPAFAGPPYTSDESNGGSTTGDTSGGGKYSLSSIEKNATTTINDIQKTVVKIAGAVGVLAIIVTLALMLFTHDDRKIAGYIKICVTIAIAMGIILLVNAGALLDLVKQLVGVNEGF